MAATTQSCSDIERTPSSDREVPRPRHKFWTVNKISKRSGQNGPELGGLWKHPYVLHAHGKASLEVDVFDVFHHADLDARVFWVRGTLLSPDPTQCLPWQEYMTKHALFCITYSTSFPVWNWMSETQLPALACRSAAKPNRWTLVDSFYNATLSEQSPWPSH